MKNIKRHIEELHIIDSQRKGWLVLSAFVAVGTLGIIFGWNFVHNHYLIWLMVSSGLLLSVIWWYWTMKLIRHIIEFKLTESQILTDIIEEVKTIKNIVTKEVD